MNSNTKEGSKKRALVFYGLYSLAVLFLLLYYRFPSDSFKEYVESAFESRAPSFALSVGSVALDLPPGLIFKDVEMSRRGMTEGVLFHTEDFRVWPEMGKILRGIMAVGIQCEAYNGSVDGTVILAERRLPGPIVADVAFKGVELEESIPLRRIVGREVRGVIEGEASFRGSPGDPLAGEAEISLVARQGGIEIMQPLLGLDVLEFTRAVFNVDLKNGRFNVTAGDMEGPDFRGTLAGTVTPAGGLPRSRLNMRGSVEPFPSFFARKGGQSTLNFVRQKLKQGKLNFSIQGTLAQPIVNFS